MGDLYIGMVLLLALSAAAFAFAIQISRRCSRGTLDTLAFIVVIGIFIYIRCLWYHTRLVSFLPFSNLVIVGNWFPIAAGALSGLVWHRIPGGTFRKSVSACALAAASLYTAMWPLSGVVPICENIWTADGICIQTTAQTCTPACAATLLQKSGIPTTEQEMAELCLTRTGTTWQGLYRGLKKKTQGTEWDVEVLSCDAGKVLAYADRPLILSVGLPKDFGLNQQAVRSESGWMPGVGHSVLLIDRSRHGRIVIADPTPGIGREEWTTDDLRMLFRGTAMRLVRREPRLASRY